MKQRIFSLLALGVLLSLPVWGANLYNRFMPGGDLTGTWNSQTIANGAIDLTGSKVTNALPIGKGGLGLSAAANHTAPVSNGTVYAATTLPACTDSAGNHLNFDQASNTFSCGTTSSAAGNTPGNPTASAGLSAVNGSATTFMRSDGAPALDQSIAPIWLGVHTWSLSEPRLIWIESDQGPDLKRWDLDINAGVFCFRTRTDADGTGQNVFCATRGTTTALTNLTFGYSTSGSYTFPFTGTATFSGAVSVDRLVLTGTSSVTNGLSVPTGNTPTAYSNSTTRFQWTSAGITLLTGGNFVAGTIGQGIQIKEGTNAKMGLATLIAGTVTVSNTAVTANSRILLTGQSLGTITSPSSLSISARVAGTSFTILASQATDTSTVAWQIVEPAP